MKSKASQTVNSKISSYLNNMQVLLEIYRVKGTRLEIGILLHSLASLSSLSDI